MKIKVIEVIVNGETKYLSSEPSIFSDCLVDDPLQAINFLVEPARATYLRSPSREYDIDTTIKNALDSLRMPNDAWYAKSGLSVEACYTVEFEIEMKEVDRKIGRMPHRNAVQ